MTRHVNLYRDGIPAAAEHIERCIVKAMGGNYFVMVRHTGRVFVCHAGRLNKKGQEVVGDTPYTKQTTRTQIEADLHRFVWDRLSRIMRDYSTTPPIVSEQELA